MRRRGFIPEVLSAGALVLLCCLACACNCKDVLPPALHGYALAIGLNSVDPAHYDGWSGDLTGCEPDAEDMRDIAISQGLQAEILLTGQATRQAVLDKLSELAQKVKSDDLLVVSYSGHGGQIVDANGDEADGLDETWCLFDGELLDDELFGAWMKFPQGARILVFSDSCHSGTVLKMIKTDYEDSQRMPRLDRDWQRMRALPKIDRTVVRTMLDGIPHLKERKMVRAAAMRSAMVRPAEAERERLEFEARLVPPKTLIATYTKNKPFYQRIGAAAPREDSTSVRASVILISGCKDNQTSADLGYNGLFTVKLELVWDNGAFTGNHSDFHEMIRAAVQEANAGQTCNFYLTGIKSKGFICQKPYSVQR